MEFLVVYILQVVAYFLAIILGAFIPSYIQEKVNKYELSGKELPKILKIFNRKPFKCELCLSSWLTLIFMSLPIFIYWHIWIIYSAFVAFCIHFFLNWRENRKKIY